MALAWFVQTPAGWVGKERERYGKGEEEREIWKGRRRKGQREIWKGKGRDLEKERERYTIKERRVETGWEGRKLMGRKREGEIGRAEIRVGEGMRRTEKDV